MAKIAAIYIRVSSQAQSEGASLTEQERMCREYAERKGYEVIKVYQDIGSGTGLKERPEFQQMLVDAENQVFDVLLAWKEDRLYRGYMDTGFIDLMRLVQNDTISVELEREHFDKTMAVIKAAMAEEENRARVERMHMGVKARLRSGKHWGIEKKYGYTLNDQDEPVIEETEAHWIRQMYNWYLEGVGVREICRKLIAEGAPQKDGISKKDPWPPSIIYRYLNDDTYSTGIHKVKRAGEVFEIPVPAIVDLEDYKEVQRRKRKNKSTPKGNTQYNYLLRGVLYSPCDLKWQAITRKSKQKYTTKDGQVNEYQAKYKVYYCPRRYSVADKGKRHHPDCPKSKGAVGLDQNVWEKVSEVLRNPGLLVSAAEERLNELKDQHQDATRRKAQLSQSLQKLEDERQGFIELYGKSLRGDSHFTEEDLKQQLDRIAEQSLEIKRELVQIDMLADTQFSDLDALVNLHLKDISRAADWLDKEPETEEEKQRQFEERKAIIDLLVKRVTISKNEDPKIEFVIDIPMQIGKHRS